MGQIIILIIKFIAFLCASVAIFYKGTTMFTIRARLFTGVGIPDYATERIFEKYYSLARPDADKKSSGLGLNFVKEVASIHGGTITVENRLDKGVRAELKLPVKLPVTV